jgi:hypothetical protein
LPAFHLSSYDAQINSSGPGGTMTASEKSSLPPPRKLGPTSYGPLPGYPSSPTSAVTDRLVSTAAGWFAPLVRLINWFLSTAAAPDTLPGRFASWAEANSFRHIKYVAPLGVIGGLGLATKEWLNKASIEPNETLQMFGAFAVGGAVVGIIGTVLLFQTLAMYASYWRWFAGFIALMFVASAIRRLAFGLP